MQKVLLKHHQTGFTLIEMVAVIAIIALLAAFIVPNVVSQLDSAKVTTAQANIKTIGNALKMYRNDNGHYPTTEQGLQALLSKPTIAPVPNNWKTGGYLEDATTLKDPWKRDFVYLIPSTHGGQFDLFSYGADGEPNGVDSDADIGNWVASAPVAP